MTSVAIKKDLLFRIYVADENVEIFRRNQAKFTCTYGHVGGKTLLLKL